MVSSTVYTVQSSARVSSSMMSSGSGSQPHLVSSRRSSSSPSLRLGNSFLPPRTSNFLSQAAAKAHTSRRICHITASGDNILLTSLCRLSFLFLLLESHVSQHWFERIRAEPPWGMLPKGTFSSQRSAPIHVSPNIFDTMSSLRILYF